MAPFCPGEIFGKISGHGGGLYNCHQIATGSPDPSGSDLVVIFLFSPWKGGDILRLANVFENYYFHMNTTCLHFFVYNAKGQWHNML